MQTIWRLQVVCTTVAGRDARTAAGYLPFVELAPAGCWRVLITHTSGSNTFASRNILSHYYQGIELQTWAY